MNKDTKLSKIAKAIYFLINIPLFIFTIGYSIFNYKLLVSKEIFGTGMNQLEEIINPNIFIFSFLFIAFLLSILFTEKTKANIRIFVFLIFELIVISTIFITGLIK